MNPFAPNDPNPQPWQIINEIRQRDMRLDSFRVALIRLRGTDPKAYIAFVAAIREKNKN